MQNSSATTKVLSANPGAYKPWWRMIAGHLGGVYPFYDTTDPNKFTLEISEIVHSREARGDQVQLDLTAIASKATLPFLLGNRTLLKEVRRAPWMALPGENGEWEPEPLPLHGIASPDPENFIQELHSALLEEARSYISESRTVGILLSGGMDSRVVAGIVRQIQQESDDAFDVVALTWGSETSRDVVYARRVADIFGWNSLHFPITAETLASNISHMAKMGAEVSPLHLHAMPQIAALRGLDAVMAGSYGDSVGRGEFSGRKLVNLKDVLPKRLDRFGVLRHEAKKAAVSALQLDVFDSPHLDMHTPSLRRHEIEQEMHYMRRMLQSCMCCIAQNKRIYQLFTSPKVFGTMWGLDPNIRGDQWYARLIPLLPGELMEIPWARTGLRYGELHGQPDKFDSSHHTYGQWLRRDLRAEVFQRANSDLIRNLGVFNDRGLDLALRAWGRAETNSTNGLDELVSWLASLHEFIKQFQLGTEGSGFSTSPKDSWMAISGNLYSKLYINARERLRD